MLGIWPNAHKKQSGAVVHDPTSDAILLYTPGNYTAAPLLTTAVGPDFDASISGASPGVLSGDPDFKSAGVACDLVGPALTTRIQDFYETTWGATPIAYERSGFDTITVDAIALTDANPPWILPHVFADHGYGAIGLGLAEDSVSPGTYYAAPWYWYPSGGAGTTIVDYRPIALATRLTVHWRMTWDGSAAGTPGAGLFQVGIDGTWGAPISAAYPIDPSLAPNRFKLGTNYNSTANGTLDGRLHAHAIYSVNKSDAFLAAMAALYN